MLNVRGIVSQRHSDVKIYRTSDVAIRISYRGGGGERGALEFSPQQQFPPPRNLEIEYGYYCGAISISYLMFHVTGHEYEIASEEDLNSKFSLGGGGHAPRPP